MWKLQVHVDHHDYHKFKNNHRGQARFNVNFMATINKEYIWLHWKLMLKWAWPSENNQRLWLPEYLNDYRFKILPSKSCTFFGEFQMLNVLDQSLKFNHFQFLHLLKYLYSQPFQCVKIYENFRKVFQTESWNKYEKNNYCHLTNHNYSMYNTFMIKGF